ADIDVTESLGSEKFVYFTRELGEAKNVAELEELARDSGRAEAGGAAAETVVARLEPAPRTTDGHESRLWGEPPPPPVFHPASRRNVTLHDSGAAAGPAGPAGAGATESVEAETAKADARARAEEAAKADGRTEQASGTADPASGTDSR